MIHRIAIAILIVASLTALGGCATPRTDNDSGDLSIVAGRITFFEHIALPPEATVHVRLIERSAAGQEQIVAERVFRNFRQRPIDFELQYDSTAGSPGSQMIVDATVFVGDRVWFRSSGNDRLRGENMNILVRSAR